jgi:hypothetical protein
MTARYQLGMQVRCSGTPRKSTMPVMDSGLTSHGYLDGSGWLVMGFVLAFLLIWIPCGIYSGVVA